MKKVFSAALAASAFVAAVPASAADLSLTLVETSPGVFTQTLGNNDITTPTFTDNWTFEVPGAGFVGSTLVTLSFTGALNFTSVLLNNQALRLTPVDGETQARGVFFTAGGPQTLQVSGTLTGGGSGSYGGNVRFQATPPIPEPATWALMILGFGVVGYAMRRRPTVRFTQAI